MRLSRKRLSPNLRNPDYLILSKRTAFFERCIERIESTDLQVLDVGGRLQPYRQLLLPRTRRYLAIDPQMDGLADIIAVAESIPFAAEQFDLVICAQVLSYVDDPIRAVAEMHRVLKPGGSLFLSVPANCPQFHDERWRFLREGIENLLAGFSSVEVFPEVHSLGGALRTINKTVDQSNSVFGKKIATRVFYPLMNRIGRRFDDRVFSSEFFTANYSAFAQK